MTGGPSQRLSERVFLLLNNSNQSDRAISDPTSHPVAPREHAEKGQRKQTKARTTFPRSSLTCPLVFIFFFSAFTNFFSWCAHFFGFCFHGAVPDGSACRRVLLHLRPRCPSNPPPQVWPVQVHLRKSVLLRHHQLAARFTDTFRRNMCTQSHPLCLLLTACSRCWPRKYVEMPQVFSVLIFRTGVYVALFS